MKDTQHKRWPEAWFGAAVALVAYLLTGFVPAMVYGGYMGLMTTRILFGTQPDESLLVRAMAGGGMALAVVATLFLYLVLGAAIFSGAGALMRVVTRRPEDEPSEA
ncbi:MAG: hypothetical protein H6704_11425 [Myxococcales bacterium]|nr:hypothetical protein [Myxococcales bacterium]